MLDPPPPRRLRADDPAQPLEEQLVKWLHDFQPDREMRGLILDTIQARPEGTPARTPSAAAS